MESKKGMSKLVVVLIVIGVLFLIILPLIYVTSTWFELNENQEGTSPVDLAITISSCKKDCSFYIPPKEGGYLEIISYDDIGDEIGREQIQLIAGKEMSGKLNGDDCSSMKLIYKGDEGIMKCS